MTFAPKTIVDLGHYLVLHHAVNLGIVGDASHTQKGISYHLGSDLLAAGAYSAGGTTYPQTIRDKAGLSLAASAIDIGRIDGTFTRLREFSVWFVEQCRSNAPGTGDIREFIYSPDGKKVLRWDRARGVSSAPKEGEAAASHLTHSHASWYRDSEKREKITPFRPFFEGTQKEDDLDPKVDIPVGRCNVAAGGTVYGDPDKKSVLIPVWTGANGVQVYSQRPGLTAIRLDMASGPAEDLRIGWVGNDKVTINVVDTTASYNDGVDAASKAAAATRK